MLLTWEMWLPFTFKVGFLHNSKDKCLNSSVFRTDVQHKHKAEFAYTRARADSLPSFLRLTDTLQKCRSGLWVKTVRMQECWRSYMWGNVPVANPESSMSGFLDRPHFCVAVKAWPKSFNPNFWLQLPSYKPILECKMPWDDYFLPLVKSSEEFDLLLETFCFWAFCLFFCFFFW